MPDLIIKPAAQSGNKVIIQDQAGGAVITTADSGATMASNVTGIPAAGVTGVLPVGVTGGSGLTALGTVAAGNLSNTAIVYPAGHVIQMRDAVTGPGSTINTSLTDQDTGINDTITITSGNKVLIIGTCTLFGAAGGNDAGCGWYFYSVGSSAQKGISMKYYWEMPGSANPQIKMPSSLIYGPYTPASTSEQVKIYYSAFNGATAYLTDDSLTSLQLWEVAG